MTLQEIRTLHAYNTWASNHVCEAAATLPPEQYLNDMKTARR